MFGLVVALVAMRSAAAASAGDRPVRPAMLSSCRNPPNPTSPLRIVRLVGVYNADSSLRGELAYWFTARLGRAHCALCDITHRLVRERSEWKACRTGLPVPFDTYHRDDQPNTIRSTLEGIAPAVDAETATGVVPLLGPDGLAECRGSTDRLVTVIEDAVRTAELEWPT